MQFMITSGIIIIVVLCCFCIVFICKRKRKGHAEIEDVSDDELPEIKQIVEAQQCHITTTIR